MPLTQKVKFDSIDTMRGIAILMVIFVHTAQKVSSGIISSNIAKYGQMGVQMFFLASAFTLCYSIDEKPLTKDMLFHFYTRRFFRIAPCYYFGIVLYLFLDVFYKFLFGHNEWNPKYSLINIAANVFFLNGLYSPANNNVVPGGWSIGTEMLFYIFFPILFKVYNILYAKKEASIFVIPLVSLGFTILFQYIVLFYNNQRYLSNNSFMYFNIINQLPVFCVGISMYFAYKHGLTKKIKRNVVLLLFVIFSGISSIFFYQISPFSLNFSLAPFFSALSFVFIFILLQEYKSIQYSIVKKIGVLSYSCYLLHFVITLYLLKYLPNTSGFLGVFLLLAAYTAVVFLTYMFSKVLYKYIEKPGIMLGKRIYGAIGLDKSEKSISS